MAVLTQSGPTILELVIQQRIFDQVIINVHNFALKGATAYTAARAQELIDAWQAGCQTGFLTGRSGQLSIQKLIARRVYPTLDMATEEGYATPPTGLLASQDPMPPLNALVLTWLTQLAGRSHRGRSYLTGFSESDGSGGKWASNAITGATAYRDAMLSVFGAGTGQGSNASFVLGVYSAPQPARNKLVVSGSGANRSYSQVSVPAYGGQFTEVVGGRVNDIVRNQRRRQIGVGS